MDGSKTAKLKLYKEAVEHLGSEDETHPEPEFDASCRDARELANRELIRPADYGKRRHQPEPFSDAYYDELHKKRYHRHNSWLESALEFARHPGETVLVLGPGLGLDAGRYRRHGTEVVVAIGPTDHPDLIRKTLDRDGLSARFAAVEGEELPVADSSCDVVVWNELHESGTDRVTRIDELYRVLKPGGKVIALFPARYDAGYWQDLALPLQYLYWQRPADPTSAPKIAGSALRKSFARFSDCKVSKRHLRRVELPHLWRVVPLVVLERIMGRVLVFKGFKPLWAGRSAAGGSEVTLARAA